MDQTKGLEIYEDTTSICRDHLRNVCQRGDRCKFKHVKLEDLDHLVDTNKDPTSHNCEYVFCHNFQNKGCNWSQCKFIHCSKAIEDNYKNTGLLPLRLKYEFEFGVHELCIGSLEGTDDKPICRSFLKGECHRGKNCRFLHTDNKLLTDDDKRLRMSQKRSWVQMSVNDQQGTDNVVLANNAMASSSYNECLQGENNFLKQQVSELKRQVSNLTATNEFLLEQNAKFRYTKQVQPPEATVYASVPISQQRSIPARNMTPTQTSRQALPVAITFSMSGQNPQVCTNETTHIITAENQTVISANDLVNSSGNQQQGATVVGQTHHTLQAQNHLPITRSIATAIVPNTITLSSNVQLNNSIITSNTGGNHQQMHTNIGNVLGPAIGQHSVNLQPTSFALSHSQNTIQQSQSMAYSMTSQSINNPLSSIATVNQHPSTIIAAAGSLAATNSVPLQQALNQSMAQSSQNIPVATALVPTNITVQTDTENIVHPNQNITQVAHRQTIVANNQPNQVSAAPLTAGGIPGSMAAVAVQVVAQGSMAQANGFHQAPGMSMSSAIIPVTIATSHQMSALVNNSGNIVVQQPQAPGARAHPCVSIATSMPTGNSISGGQRQQQVMSSIGISGHRIVANQMSSPITYTINPSGPVQHA